MNEMDHEIHFANETNYWWFKSRRNFLKKILKSIPNRETKTVLEVGCGTGGNLKYLFNEFKFASGIDNSLNALSIINKFNLDVKVKFGDANKLNVIKEKYDLIALLDVLYHEDIINVEKVINQTRHCLNDNGFILISEPAFDILSGMHSNTVQEKRRFNKRQLESYLKNAGYKNIIISRYWGFILFPLLVIKRRIFEPIMGKQKNNADTDFKSIPLIDTILFILTSLESIFFSELNFPLGSSCVILAKK
tara:strand:- start:1536 stop:2282 length:747 start_codon:yes stop_codon:yes gene_type:complete